MKYILVRTNLRADRTFSYFPRLNLSIALVLGAILNSTALLIRTGRGVGENLGARGVPLQGRLNGGHAFVPITLKGLEIRAEDAAEGGQRAVAG